VNKDVLSQTEILIVHQLTAKLERKEIEAWVRDKAKDGEDSLEQLDALQAGECFFWSPGLMRVFAKVKVGKKFTYDSSATPEIGDESHVAPRHLSAGDMSHLKEAMATIVEELEAKDPAKLQAALKEAKERATVKDARIAWLEHERDNRVESEVIKEVSVVTDADLEQIRAAAGAVVSAVDPIAKLLEKLAEAQSAPRPSAPPRPSAAPQPQPPMARPRKSTPGVISAALLAQKPVCCRDGLHAAMSGPEQRVLNALAWLESIGVERPEINAVAFLSGYKPGGGAFNNTKGSLRTKSLVEYAPGKRVFLTASGRLHAQSPDVPLDTQELHSQVIDRLSGPERRILRPLLEAWPGTLSNAALADAAEYGAGGGAFNNARGRLRTLGLIDYPERGQVRARDLLFLGHHHSA
jgi:hypothetical protein